jgi:hypothetical protein
VNVIGTALPRTRERMGRSLLVEESPIRRGRRVGHLDPAGEVTGELGQHVLRPVGWRHLVHTRTDTILAKEVTHLIHETRCGHDHGGRA